MKKILAILALIIALPVSAATYNVQGGDTLHKIAQSFNSTVNQLLQINPQIENPDLIYAGATLEVPDKIRGADLFYAPIFGGGAGIPITDYETTLTSPLTSMATTINVATVKTTDGHTLTTSDIAPAIYLVLDSDSSTKKEIVKCTTITGSAFTGCTRGLAFYGAEASVAANKYPHSAGSLVVLSDVHLLFVSLNAAQTWTGLQTFNQYPVYQDSSTAPTSTAQFTPKFYVDALAQQGGVTSTEALTGITQLGTQLEMASSTWDGDSPTVIQTQYTTSSPDVRGLYIPVAENDGYLNQGWLDLTENFAFTGTNTFTGSSEFASTTFNASTTWGILPEYTSDPIGDNEAVRKSYVDSMFAVTAGDILVASADTDNSHTETDYTITKEMNIGRYSGTLRIKFAIRIDAASSTYYGRIYRNGVAVGTERSGIETAAQTYSEDIAGWSAGDLLQLYQKRSGGGDTVHVTNFRMYVNTPLDIIVNID